MQKQKRTALPSTFNVFINEPGRKAVHLRPDTPQSVETAVACGGCKPERLLNSRTDNPAAPFTYASLPARLILSKRLDALEVDNFAGIGISLPLDNFREQVPTN